jgi:hypothetical protein
MDGRHVRKWSRRYLSNRLIITVGSPLLGKDQLAVVDLEFR